MKINKLLTIVLSVSLLLAIVSAEEKESTLQDVEISKQIIFK